MTSPLIAIVDYGMGNLFSVARACEHVGLNTVITSDAGVVRKADGIILPGVGAFGDAMAALDTHGLSTAMRDAIKAGKPFFGICLGMQLLMEESFEFGHHQGLGVIAGSVVRFENPQTELGKTLKVPEVGWNAITPVQVGQVWDDTPLEGVSSGTEFYFVHSYYVIPTDPNVWLSVSRYGNITYCSTLRRENVFACQYHPERSGPMGLKMYHNFAKDFLQR